MLDRLPWGHSIGVGSGRREAPVDARGSTVQLANGFLYLDAAADPAHCLLGYDEPPQVAADAASVALKLERMATGYRCAAFAAGLAAAMDLARDLVGVDAAPVDALAGEPGVAAGRLIAIENGSLGRAGGWLASRSWRRKPEAIVIGEAIAAGGPFAAILLKERPGGATERRIGEALGRSVLARVAGVIDAVEAGGLLDEVPRLAAYLTDRLKAAKAASDGEIAALSRLPFGAAIRFRTRSAERMKRKLCERGVLVGLAGNCLVILPPLIIRPAELDVISGALRGALYDTPTWRPAACCAACEGLAAG